MKNTKLERSYNAHKRAADYHYKRYVTTKSNSKKSFISEVKHWYHLDVASTQKDKKRFLTRAEKKQIFNKHYNNVEALKEIKSYPKYDLASAERKYDKYDSKVDNELRQQNYQRKRNLKDTKLYNKYH